MKTKKLILILTALPFIFISCGNSFAEQIKREMQTLKSQCPQYQGDGITITDANFYESEKILEYVCSIEGVEYIEADIVEEMKKGIVEALISDVSAFEKYSVKIALKNGYRYRYIYTDTSGNELCEIEVTKDDLP